MELLKSLQAITKMSPAQIIQTIFPAHLHELYAYLAWLEQLPKDSSVASTMGPHLLRSFGPETLIQSIKRIDPTYQTPSEKLDAKISATKRED